MSLNGEIFFDMTRDPHRLYGKSKFMLKRWRKFDIFTKTGSFVRSENPRANTYASTSVYLYDYVVVDDTFFYNNVVTSSYVSSVPNTDVYWAGSNTWTHSINTWKNSPNAVANNYLWRYNPFASDGWGRPIYGFDPTFPGTASYSQLMSTPIYRDDGTYFEIVRGYPRSHFYHRRSIFALERFTSYGIQDGSVTTQVYQKGRNTAQTTIGLNGISDGSDPVQATQVSNVDIIKSDNVIYH